MTTSEHLIIPNSCGGGRSGRRSGRGHCRGAGAGGARDRQRALLAQSFVWRFECAMHQTVAGRDVSEQCGKRSIVRTSKVVVFLYNTFIFCKLVFSPVNKVQVLEVLATACHVHDDSEEIHLSQRTGPRLLIKWPYKFFRCLY